MRKRLPVLLSLLLFAVVLSAGMTASAAERRTATVNVNALNVRSGPSTAFSRLTTALRGSLLPVLSQQDDWLRVRLPGGRSGWVASRYATIRETTAPAPAAQAQAGTAMVNVPVLNVRKAPDASSVRLGVVSRGMRLSVLGSRGDWLRVRLPEGLSGWVFATYTGTSTPQQAAELPRQQRQTVAVAPSAAPTERQVFVTVDGSTIWSGPGFETRQVSTISRGTSLAVLSEQGDWLQVRLSDGELGWIASWLVAADAIEPQTPLVEPRVVEQPTMGSPLSGRIIVLDPGHGIDPSRGWATGAVGITGLVEDGLVLDISLHAAELLRQAGATVVLTRSDTTVALRQRVAIAEQAQAHVFVSVHANAYFSRVVSGTETFYFRGKLNSTESYWLAVQLQNEMVRAFSLPDRGVRHGNFHVIRETTMPSALVEFGFLSNMGDEALMRTPQFRAAAAHAIFLGLERFFQPR